MGCCECLIADKDCIVPLGDNNRDLEIVQNPKDAPSFGRNAKDFDFRVSSDSFDPNRRVTPSEIKVTIVKLPDNSNEASIASWKNDFSSEPF